MFQNVNGFHLQNFRRFRVQLTNVNFVGTLVLLRIPQRVNIGSCSGFPKMDASGLVNHFISGS